MSNTLFSQNEIEYLKSQRLARIGTAAISNEGYIQTDVTPVGFGFDGDYFYVGGMNILKSTKYKNVVKNNNVAIVIDDLGDTNRGFKSRCTHPITYNKDGLGSIYL
jgi:pyridoxamine 5'-phosphate oxidase family protein